MLEQRRVLWRCAAWSRTWRSSRIIKSKLQISRCCFLLLQVVDAEGNVTQVTGLVGSFADNLDICVKSWVRLCRNLFPEPVPASVG